VSGHITSTRVASLLASVALAGGALATVAPAASAAPAMPTSLTPNGPVSSSTPTLTWKRVTGATSYTVQVDDSAAFDSVAYSVTTVNNRAVPTLPLPDGTVHWRVLASNNSGNSAWASSDIEISPSAAPAPVSPVEGASLAQPNDPPLLTWSATAGAVGYRVQVAVDDAFTSPTLYSTPGTSFVVPTPQTAGDYYWRVQADRGNGLSTAWSDPAHFVVEALPDVQVDPSMNSGLPMQDVVLDWLPVLGAAKYEIRVGLDPDFNSLIEQRTVLGTRYSPVTTYDNDQFFWEARAINTGGTASEWPATPWEFQRNWPERPELLFPADTINPTTGDDFYYQWSPVNTVDGTVLRHTTEYQLQVGNDPNFSPGTFDTCTTASTTYTAGYGTNDNCMPSQGAVTYWRVRAIDAPKNVQGIYSEIHSFIYDSGPVSLLSPANGAIVDVPTLKWSPARDALKYYVEIRNAADSKVTSATTYATSWTPDNALASAAGPFSWTVQAYDADGHLSPKYSGRTFSLSGSKPDTGVPDLTPLTGISTDAPTSRFPSLSWEPAATATSYRIQIGVHNSGFWLPTNTSAITNTAFDYSAATDVGTYFLAPNSYDWRVQGFNGTTSLGYGPVDTFTIVDLPPVAGQRIALSGQALDGASGASCSASLGTVVSEEDICIGVPTTPVLDWDPVPGAGLYMVYLANDRELTNRIFTGVVTTNSRWTPNASMSPEALADNTAGQSYYWYIRPCKTTGACNPDPVSTNAAATNAFRKSAPPIDLLSPANNSQVTTGTNEATFSWRDYLASNQETIYPSNADGDLSTAEATSYKIAVSQSQTMLPLLSGFPKVVDQTTYTPFDLTLPEGPLYWRVQAVDAQGNGLTWSPTWSFTKRSPRVTLASPVDGVVTSGATAFRWQAAPGAASYTLEVYKNNDTLYQTANRVLSVTGIKQTAYQWSKYLPSSAANYVWRVRYVDAGGKSGPWTDPPRDASEAPISPAGAFSVHTAALSLTAPASGAYQPAAAPYFSWLPVANAATYYLEVRPSGSTSPTIKQVTAAQAFAVTGTMKDGSYEWRVTARDPNAGTLAQSTGWRGFKIDTTRPVVVSKSPVTAASRTANFVAKFSEPVYGVGTTTMKLYVLGRTTPLSAAVTLSSNRLTATLNPSSNLVSGKIYTLRLTSGIKDKAGNTLAATSWSAKAQ